MNRCMDPSTLDSHLKTHRYYILVVHSMKPYTCPRCGYTTQHRTSIRNHLFNKTKTCPALENDIVLTDDIREYILANRIYKVVVATPTPMQAPVKANKKKKAHISKSLRMAVWDAYIGLEIGKIKCRVCNVTMICQLDFECGHVVAESLGGPTTLANLLPICGTCNCSMQVIHLHEFRKLFIIPAPTEVA